MRIGYVALALAGVVVVAPAGTAKLTHAAPARAGLCGPGETVIFECRLGAKRVAVCGGTGTAGAYAQYRLGTPAKLELEYPARTDGGLGGMHHAETAYSGGGEAQVIFPSGGFQYVVYSRMVRTNFKANEPNDPAFEAGVEVLKGDKAVSKRKCTPTGGGDVDVEAAAKFMPEGEFIYLP